MQKAQNWAEWAFGTNLLTLKFV